MSKSESVFGECPILLGVMKNEGFLYFTQSEVDHGVSEHDQEKIVRTLVRKCVSVSQTEDLRGPDASLLRLGEAF